MNYADLRKLTRAWSKLLIKGLKDYAKQNTKTWYGAKFSPKSTPFKVAYSKKKNAVFVWGVPPNKNVDKHHKKNKRIPWGKTSEVSTTGKYTWHGEHYHRVFIADSEVDVSRGFGGAHRTAAKSTKGFWFTAKNKLENTGTTFYTKNSHYSIEANSSGYKRIKGKAGRSYPFPAQWKFDTEGLHFDYHFDSVADKVMNSPELANIIDKTLTDAFSATGLKLT